MRELENIIDRLIIVLHGQAPSPVELETVVEELLETSRAERGCKSSNLLHEEVAAEDDTSNQPPTEHLTMEIKRFKVEKLLETLRKTGGNKSEAARLLGISRTTLWRQLRDLGIE